MTTIGQFNQLYMYIMFQALIASVMLLDEMGPYDPGKEEQ